MKHAIIRLVDENCPAQGGMVENIIVSSAQGIRGLQLPLDCMLWEISQLEVAIGDQFCDGSFTREGEPVTEPTQADELCAIGAQNNGEG